MSGRLTRSINRALRRTPAPLRRPAARVAVRVYEAYLSAHGARKARDGSPGPDPGPWPIPPARLRVKVAWTPDRAFFLDSGRGQAEFIRGLVARHAGPVEEMLSILDFGCGCGRIARWWSDLDGVELHGCDQDRELVDWCSRNLPFLDTAVNDIEPPLPYGEGRFDLIYALSVFTHLPEELQRSWLDELMRILRPGGLLFFTAMGTGYLDQLSPEERAAFERGEQVTRFDEVPGSNLCAAYHPPGYVEDEMLPGAGLELLTAVHPGSGDATALGLLQDSYLARRP